MNKQLAVHACSRRTIFSSLPSLRLRTPHLVAALALAASSATACTGDDDKPAADGTGTTAMTPAQTGTADDDVGIGAESSSTDAGLDSDTADDGQDESSEGDTAGSDTQGEATQGDTAGETESGSDDSTGGEGIEIAGVWIEEYPEDGMVTHTIDDTMWEQNDAQFGPFTYTLSSFDNATRTAIGDDGTSGFAKLQWTWVDGDAELWYCTAAFGAASAEEAAAGPDADDTSPSTGGCSGFAWSRLMEP